MGKCLVLLLFWLNLPVHNCANVAETFYPYGPENGDSYGCPNDDQPYGPITVENGFPFFGEVYDQIYISANGAITGNPFKDFEPKRFPMQGTIDPSSLCDSSQSDDPNCWLNSYYEYPNDWQNNPDRPNYPCLNGQLFQSNSGIAQFDFVFRFNSPGPYTDPQCIGFTETENNITDWIIAVYWHDIDITVGEGKFLFRETTDAGILAMAKADVENMAGFTGEFNPTWGFVITWMNVTFFNGDKFGYPFDCEDKGFSSDCEPDGFIENSMQLVVATDGTKSYGIFNYGAMNWGGGQVGFDAGDNVNFCSASGSRTDAILRMQDRSNANVKGRYVMSFSDMNFNAEMCEPHASLPACTCNEGYEGILCGKEVDDCELAKCPEGGACVDGNNTFECECGLNCQQGSNCTFDGSKYICECAHPSHSGELCDGINYCHGITCENNGTCEDQPDTYKCICTDGWTGTLCSDVDHCGLAKENCTGHGTCVNDASGEPEYSCQCNTGWTGEKCADCPPGFSGDDCEQYDHCGLTVVLCQESTSTCVNAVDGYMCDCLTEDWLGDYCNVSNKCSSSPCQNGGTCIPQEEEYICNCPDGYNATRNCEASDSGINPSDFDHQVQDDVPSLLTTVGGSMLGLLGLLALIGLIIFLVLKRRKKKIQEAKEKKEIIPMQNNWTSTVTTKHGMPPKGHPPMIHSKTLSSLDVVPNSYPPAMFVMET